MITAFGSEASSWIFLQALTNDLMPKPRSKCVNCSMDPGESIVRTDSSQDILRLSFGIRFGLLSTIDEPKGLLWSSGFILLQHPCLKLLRLSFKGTFSCCS